MVMDNIIISKAIISKDFNGSQPVRFGVTENGSMFARFRVGTKKYDKNAQNNVRWQNYTVFAYGKVAARLEKVSPTEGMSLSLIGEFSMETWTDKQGVVHETPTVFLQGFEIIAGRQNSEKTDPDSSKEDTDEETQSSQNSSFTGYESFLIKGPGFFDDCEEI